MNLQVFHKEVLCQTHFFAAKIKLVAQQGGQAEVKF